MIQTTIYINNDYLKLLENASLITGRSKRSIISSLMLRLSGEHDLLIKPWKQIQYQKRGKDGDYHRFHLALRPNEYEMFLDLRKFFKKSVSLLVAHAINVFLDEMISIIKKKTDNYPGICYLLNNLVIDGVICWVISWGVTTKLLSHPIFCTT